MKDMKSKLADVYRDMLAISERMPESRPGYHTFTFDYADTSTFWSHPVLERDRATLFDEWKAETFNRYSKRLNGVKFVLEFDAAATIKEAKGGVL